MATTRIKEKLSTLVNSQLPEFIRYDYDTFVTFLEAYYEYLEQDQYAHELLQNSRSYSDIDTTIDSFVQYFLQQYCSDIPKQLFTNKKLLFKNIKDLYNSKGSEKSFKLFFKIAFNKNVEFYYPYESVLKASDGRWVQKYSLFLKVTSGDPTSIANKEVLLYSNSLNTYYRISLFNKEPAYSINGEDPNIFEYYFDNSKNIPISVGDVIELSNVRAEVVGVPNSITIVNPGVNFKIGDILPLTLNNGVTSKVKVTQVTSVGGIKTLQFITYGIGYTNNFYNFFSASEGIETPETFTYVGSSASISERTRGFADYGTITTPTFSSEQYFAEDYQGIILGTFFTDTSINISSGVGNLGSIRKSTGLPGDATLFVKLGSKCPYPGYFATIDGFLSDEIYIQNEHYYQPYSYVLKIDENLQKYKKAVIDLLHPAGMNLLGTLTLNNSFNLNSTALSLLRILPSEYFDTFEINDLGVILNTTKNIITSQGVNDIVLVNFNGINTLGDELIFADEGGFINTSSFYLEHYFEQDYVGTNFNF